MKCSRKKSTHSVDEKGFSDVFAAMKSLIPVALVLMCGVAAAETMTFPLRLSRCGDALTPLRRVQVGQEAISTYDSIAQDIVNLREEMNALNTAGIVVYLPIMTFDRSQTGNPDRANGMATIRFETQGADRPVLENLLLPRKRISEAQFETLLQSAQKPSASQARQELRDFLSVEDNRDDGKKVFLKDSNFYGVIPQSFGLNDAVSIASASLTDAIARRDALATRKIRPQDFFAVVGYPDDAIDYQNVFSGQSVAPLASWRERTAEFQSMARQQHVDLVTASELRKMAGKRELLSYLEHAKGIVFIVAHADGYTVRLPGDSNFVITPQDIADLHFDNAPFVILRICNAVDHGYADAFARAGAAGVWANRGVISAQVANRQIRAFFEALKEGHSIIESINKVESVDQSAKSAVGLFTLLVTFPNSVNVLEPR